MRLNRLLPSALRGESRERGSAIVNVVILTAVSALVVLAVGGSMVAASGTTISARNQVSARAAADAGLNWALGELNRGYFLCNADRRGETPAFEVHVAYRSESNTELADCGSGTVSGPIGAAVITSTGLAGPGSSVTHQLGAEAQITLATSGSELNQAIFTESALNLSNDSVIEGSAPGALDGDIYTNGDFDCRTQNRIEGSVVALGTMNIWNTCAAMESVWGGGNMDFKQSDVNLSGDVVAYGTIQLGRAHVAGDVIANGNITLGDQSNRNCGSGPNVNVCGSIVSLAGSIALGQNGSPVAGGLYARSNITLSNNPLNPLPTEAVSLRGTVDLKGGKVAGRLVSYNAVAYNNAGNIVSANTCARTARTTSPIWAACAESAYTLPVVSAPIATFEPEITSTMGTPAETFAVAKPPRQSFPLVASDPAALSSHWSGWTVMNVPASDPMCASSGGFNSGITSIVNSTPQARKTLVVFDCAGKVNADNFTVNLRGNLALMSRQGFVFGNTTSVNSPASYGGPYSLLVIVPSDGAGISWTDLTSAGYPGQKKPSCSPLAGGYSADIRFGNTIQAGTPRPQIFLYTPCDVFIQNRGNGFDGQIYSGTGSYPAGIIIKRAVMTVPGAEVPGSPGTISESSARLVSRYDIG